MSTRKGKKPKDGEPLFYEEKKAQCNMMLTPTTIASLDKVAKGKDISRSELIEQYGRNYHLIEAVLDVVEEVLCDGSPTDTALPPGFTWGSYEVTGSTFRKLSEAFEALKKAEEKE